MEEIIRHQKLDITKNKQNLSELCVGIGWKLTREYPKDLILDFAAILGDDDGHFYDKSDFIYYNNPVLMGRREPIVKHLPVKEVYETDLFDDREQIKISLFDVPRYITSIVFVAAVFDAENNGHTLKEMPKLHIHLFNEETKEELLFSKMDNYFDRETCCIFGRLYRSEGDEWKYEDISEGYIGSLGTLFGIHYRGEKISKIEVDSE